MTFVFTFIAAMLVSMVLLPPLIVFGKRFRFVDQPSPRKVHAAPIPRIGGLAIGVAMFAALLVVDLSLLSDKLFAILLAGLVVLLTGLVDDRHELGYRVKFAAQIAAALLVVYLGDIRISELLLAAPLVLPDWVSGPLSVFVIVALVNAVALSDGLDGLAGGIVFICCTALALLGYSTGNTGAALLAVALAGAIFGFLRFNTHPAVIFMGDSGSQFLGLMSAVLAIEVTQSQPGRIGAALPLLLLAVPVIDTMQVMVSRVLRGRSPFKPDKYHLHHRLLGLGIAHAQTVLIIYLVQCAFFLLAFFFRFESDLFLLAVFAAAAALLLAAILLPTRWRDQAARWSNAISRVRESASDSRWRPAVVNTARWMALLTLGAYVLLLVYAVAEVGDAAGRSMLELQQLALVLAAAVLASFALRSGRSAAVVGQSVGYVLAAMLAFTAASAIGDTGPLASIELGLLVVLGVANLTWLILGQRRGAQMTALDVLVLFAALVVPNLPGIGDALDGIGRLVLRLACLFYAAEVVAASWRSRIAFRFALVACLGLIAINRPFTDVSLSALSFGGLP